MKRIITLISTIFLALSLFTSNVALAKNDKSVDHAGIEVVVNINKADAEELKILLVGIGDSKARAIVDYRKVNGDFVVIDDLSNVKGIGKKLVDKNRSRIVL